jgi:Multidrug resistance efflux pump
MKVLVTSRRCALFLLLSALPWLAWAGDEVPVSAEQMKKLGIETRSLATPQGGAGIAFPAQVIVPNGQLQVVSVPVSGLVESVLVAVNQPVKKGQPLARLQSPALIEAQREFLTAATQSGLAGRT